MKHIVLVLVSLLTISASTVLGSSPVATRVSPYSTNHELVVPEIVEKLGISEEQRYWLNSAVYHHLIGVQYYYEKQYGAAIKHLTMANNMSPDNPVILIRLAKAYERVGEQTYASNYFKRAYQLKPELKDLGVNK